MNKADYLRKSSSNAGKIPTISGKHHFDNGKDEENARKAYESAYKSPFIGESTI